MITGNNSVLLYMKKKESHKSALTDLIDDTAYGRFDKRKSSLYFGQYIAVKDKERFVQQFFGVFHRAGGAQRRIFDEIRKDKLHLGAVAEVALDGLGQVAHSQDDILYAVTLEVTEQVLQEGPVQHRHHRLGDVAGQGAQPGAFSPHQDNCFLRFP